MRPTLRFVEVQDPGAVATVASLAAQIWREYYPPLIGTDQVEYMLSCLQSAAAITEQIRSAGYRYFLVEEDGVAVGYIAVTRQEQALLLSKFYLVAGARGLGHAAAMMAFVQECARAAGCPAVTLTVYRGNERALAAYRRLGFVVIGPIEIDIGGGFTMTDYRLEKSL